MGDSRECVTLARMFVLAKVKCMARWHGLSRWSQRAAEVAAFVLARARDGMKGTNCWTLVNCVLGARQLHSAEIRMVHKLIEFCYQQSSSRMAPKRRAYGLADPRCSKGSLFLWATSRSEQKESGTGESAEVAPTKLFLAFSLWGSHIHPFGDAPSFTSSNSTRVTSHLSCVMIQEVCQNLGTADRYKHGRQTVQLTTVFTNIILVIKTFSNSVVTNNSKIAYSDSNAGTSTVWSSRIKPMQVRRIFATALRSSTCSLCFRKIWFEAFPFLFISEPLQLLALSSLQLTELCWSSLEPQCGTLACTRCFRHS